MDQSFLRFITIIKFLGVCPLAEKIGKNMELLKKGMYRKTTVIFMMF